MKQNCIVCATEFLSPVSEHRLTCCDNCRKKFADFRSKLSEVNSAEYREKLIREFLTPIEAKERADNGQVHNGLSHR